MYHCSIRSEGRIDEFDCPNRACSPVSERTDWMLKLNRVLNDDGCLGCGLTGRAHSSRSNSLQLDLGGGLVEYFVVRRVTDGRTDGRTIDRLGYVKRATSQVRPAPRPTPGASPRYCYQERACACTLYQIEIARAPRARVSNQRDLAVATAARVKVRSRGHEGGPPVLPSPATRQLKLI